jgi:hypothetical protein
MGSVGIRAAGHRRWADIVAAQRACINAFFDLHLAGKSTRLLDHPSSHYPELARHLTRQP